MITERLTPVALTTVMLLALPGMVVAQDDQPLSGPEGPEWSLTAFYDDDAAELVTVPVTVEPTLMLEDGTASGFGGCNQFRGDYALDGGSLSFSDEIAATLVLCDEPVQDVEDAYLSQLAEVDGWLIDDSVLKLTDSFGDARLTFEVPSILWTPGQVAALMSALADARADRDALRLELQTLRDDVESLNVSKLRQRIKALEADNKDLRKRVSALEDEPQVDAPSGPVSFNSAEKTLLKGIPGRIAGYCTPRRSALPKSTRAAVTCRPNTTAVETVDYFLMNGADAAAKFGADMDAFNVEDVVAADKTCAQGTKSQRVSYGNGWKAEGCYRNRGTAYLQFIDNAADCRKLKVAGKNMANPAILVTVQGADLKRAYAWATKTAATDEGTTSSLTQPIPSNLAISPSCGG